jgi:hypothetical protein
MKGKQNQGLGAVGVSAPRAGGAKKVCRCIDERLYTVCAFLLDPCPPPFLSPVVLKQRRVEIITDKAGTLKYSFYHDADKDTTTLTQSSVSSETTEAEANITWTDSSDLKYLSVQYTVEENGIGVTTEGGRKVVHKWYQAKKDNKNFRLMKSGSQKKERELLMKNLTKTFGEQAAKKYDFDDSDVYQLISQQENERGITIFTVFKKGKATTSNIRYFRDYTRSLTEEEKEAGDHARTSVQAQVNSDQQDFFLEEGRILIDGDTMTIKAENPDLEDGGKMQRSAKEAIGEKRVWKEDIDTTIKAQEHKKNFTKDKYCYLEKKTARDVKKNGFGDEKDYKVCVINDGKVETELVKGANLRLGSMTGYVIEQDGEDVVVLDGEEVQLRGEEEGEYTLNKSEKKVTIKADKMYLYGKTLGNNSKEGWLLNSKYSRSVILDSVTLRGLTRSKDFTFGGLFEGFTLCGLRKSSGHYTGKRIVVTVVIREFDPPSCLLALSVVSWHRRSSPFAYWRPTWKLYDVLFKGSPDKIKCTPKVLKRGYFYGESASAVIKVANNIRF